MTKSCSALAPARHHKCPSAAHGLHHNMCIRPNPLKDTCIPMLPKLPWHKHQQGVKSLPQLLRQRSYWPTPPLIISAIYLNYYDHITFVCSIKFSYAFRPPVAQFGSIGPVSIEGEEIPFHLNKHLRLLQYQLIVWVSLYLIIMILWALFYFAYAPCQFQHFIFLVVNFLHFFTHSRNYLFVSV